MIFTFFLNVHSQALFFNFLAQFEDALNQGFRTGRAAGNIDIAMGTALRCVPGTWSFPGRS